MRTTLSLAPDVTVEVKRLRREHGLGVSEAVNQLARRGMAPTHRGDRPVFRQQTASLGARVSLDNVSEVLDLLDEA